MVDDVHAIDRQQSDPVTARVCQKDPTHGRLTATGNGMALVCARYLGKTKRVSSGDGVRMVAECCDYGEPLSR